MKNFYEILGVPAQATLAEIKAAYKRRSLDTHPDRNRGDEARLVEFAQVQDANKVLGDSAKRGAYDAALRAARGAADEAAITQAWAEAPVRAQKAAAISAGIVMVGGVLATLFAAVQRAQRAPAAQRDDKTNG